MLDPCGRVYHLMLTRSMALSGTASRMTGRPNTLPNCAAYYDVGDITSLRNNAGNIPGNGDSIKLVSDKSGNSAVNCLCLNAAAGNYASVPHSAAMNITGDIDIMCLVAMNDWTPAASSTVMARWGAGNQAWALNIGTTGAIEAFFNGAQRATSSAAIAASDMTRLWIRMTRQQSSGDIKFYTGGTGTTPLWVQLGTTQNWSAGTATTSTTITNTFGSLDSGTSPIACRIYRGMVYNGYDGAGTVQLDANFTAASKLAAFFTESSANAATVTINTSGDTGARISGERDLYQFTSTKQPVLTIASTGNYLTFDGTDDYMKAPSFSLSQPETVYFVGQQVTWFDFARVYDGSVDNSMLLYRSSSSPNIRPRAGVIGALNPDWAVGANAIVSAVFNGASSLTRVNRAAAVIGDAGTSAGGGLILAASNAAANFGNIRASEIAIYAAAHTTAEQDNIIVGMGARWGISV